MRFEGKTAIVTGGSGGIGGACVTQLVSEGARVALVDQSDPEVSQDLIEKLQGAPGEVRAFQADVRDAERAGGDRAGRPDGGDDRPTMARRDRH